MESLLKVESIEVLHSDKTNSDFKRVVFKGVKILGNREVKTNVSGTRNLWPAHDVELADGTKKTIKGDVEYDNINVGDLFTGAVSSFTTTPYQVDGRTINQYKCVVFDHEDGMVVAAKNLRQNNAAPLDEDGNAYQLIINQPKVASQNGQQTPAAAQIEP